MIAKGLLKTVAASSICVLALSVPNPAKADNPINNGMAYFNWESSGGPSFSQNGNGNYSASWSGYGGDFTTGTGWCTWYGNLPSAPWPWVQIGYNCGAFSMSGGFGSFGGYGWFTAPYAGRVDTEFYIVEMSGGNPLYLQGGQIGTVNSDGGTYKIYHNYFPSQHGISGAPLEQWISIRQGNNSAGQNHYISLWNHFNAWQSLGWQMGNFDDVRMSTEGGGGGSGYVNATAWLN